jgi:hypothetical protein
MMDIKKGFHFLKNSIQKEYKRKQYLKTIPLSDVEKKYLETLRKDGICVIEDYWSQEKCGLMKDCLESEIEAANTKNVNFEDGVYIRFNKGKNQKDDGVVRIYHVEKKFTELSSFRHDPMILKVASAYFGTPMFSNFIAFQHNFLSENGTREYHVDWWENEFKAFLYLEDVNMDNGPFSYIIGSNKAYKTRKDKLLKDGPNNTSFFEHDLKAWIKKEQPIIAKAGSLILADVVGFHRGLPQVKKTRSILYNNIYSKDIDQFPEK